jgi:ATP-dependent DNA helicase RecG
LLQNLGLGENGKKFNINNAGVMFFGKKRDYYIRQVYVTCVLFKGTNKVKIIDRKDFRDGLLQDYENAYKFLQQHLRLEYVIEGGGPRKEIPEIPYEALKEALLNAIIHRDYFEIGARVMVEIFDDRVEISNPGELLVDEKEFGKKAISVARNPILFDIFHRLQLIEKVGTGIQRILSAMQSRKLNIEFYFGRFFSITFFRPIPQGPAPIWHQVGTKSAPSWDQVGTKLGLSEHHVSKILDYCLEDRAIADIMTLFNRKDRTKFKETFINPLIEQNLLIMTSPGKPRSSKQTYITTPKGKKILESIPSAKDQTNDLSTKSAPGRHQVGTKSALSWDQVGAKLGLSEHHVSKILEFCLEDRAIADIMTLFNRKDRTKFRETFINPLIEEDLLVMTLPGKPKSSKQKYIITDRGKEFLEYLKN